MTETWLAPTFIRNLSKIRTQHVTLAFFRGSGGSIMTSFGIARRYARIWTPWHYNKPFLVSAMRQIISKTEDELTEEYQDSLDNYVDYYRDAPVLVDDKPLQGESRRTFQRLMKAIVHAAAKDGTDTSLQDDLLTALVAHKSDLHLEAASHFDCNNCGGGLGRCPECLLPYEARAEKDSIRLVCPKCKRSVTPADGVTCECGAVSEILAIESHLQLYPDSPMLEAMASFIDLMDHVSWKGAFLVDGRLLRLLQERIAATTDLPDRISLTDLRRWRRQAHHHQRPGSREYLPVLRKSKELCFRNGERTTKKRCEDCLATTPSPEQLTQCELCLPRIIGLAIDQGFDGLHHGYEIADVMYDDVIDTDDRLVKIGLHLKTRNDKPKPHGEGRSTRRVKALYTQVFYSAYRSLQSSDVDFDVIGISMPNRFNDKVVASFQALLKRLGFALLVVDEEDWLKIMGSANEHLQFSHAHSRAR
jgi:hypothetical protein